MGAGNCIQLTDATIFAGITWPENGGMVNYCGVARQHVAGRELSPVSQEGVRERNKEEGGRRVAGRNAETGK
mgnify:CR=1 FL=1